MRYALLALLLFTLLIVPAAAQAPWITDLFVNTSVSSTALTKTATLEPSATEAYILYDLAKTSDITATFYITIAQGWDGVKIVTTTTSASITPWINSAGVVTLTTTYPDMAVTVRAGSAGAVVSSLSLRQR